MREDRFTCAVGFGNDGFGQLDGHGEYAIRGDGTRKNFDSIRTISDLLAHSFDGLRYGCDLRRRDVVLFKESFHVDRSSTLRVKRFSDGENSRPTCLSLFYSPPDVVRVI